MPGIPSRFVDLDLTKDAHYVLGDTTPCTAGGFDLFTLPGALFYEENLPLYPESDWPQLVEQMDANGGTGLDRLVTKIKNQKQEGSCVGNCWSQMCEILQAMQFGLENVVLTSAMSLYRQIGSSAQSGANIDDARVAMRDVGILPADNDANKARGFVTHPDTGWSVRLPENWQAFAANLRITENYIVRSVQGLVSALINGHPVGVGRAGHSICYCRPVYDGRNLLVRYANSWGGDWSDAGFGYDSLWYIQSSAGYAIAARSLTVPQWMAEKGIQPPTLAT